MGTIKLNKKVRNNEVQQIEVTEKAVEKKFDKTISENIINETAEDFELCELEKRDDGFVEEFKNLRTENETVYRRNDRTCRKVITTIPTRYFAADGEYKKIGNSLIDNGKEIINEENSFKIKFNKDKHNSKIFDLQKGKKTITLFAADSEKSCNHPCGCKCELCTGKDNTVISTLDDGTEIHYITLNDRIKENIIIKNRQDSYEYNFTLHIGDLSVEEGENNDLLLKDIATGETEFIIPAPYMYDANKKYSDKVSYEIEIIGEELLINVIADKDFINASDRVFPITIDPQIVLSSKDSGVTIKYGCRVQTFDEDETIEHYPGVLDVYEYETGERSEAYIYYKTPTDIDEGTIVSVKLVLTCLDGYGVIDITGAESFEPSNEKSIDVEIDVTNTISGDIQLMPSSRVFSSAHFATAGDFAPRFIIDYIASGTETPNIKEFDLCDKAKGYLDLNSGVLTTAFTSFSSEDFVLPINITHLHRTGNGNGEYGLDWRLNLNKQLKVSSKDNSDTTIYTYVDEAGDYYTFKEEYYYIQDDVKVPIDKSYVKIDLNGNLTVASSGETVYKYQYCKGNTLITEINDFDDSELIEQKQSEQIELEEYVKSCETSFKNYVVASAKTGKINNKLNISSKNSFNSSLSGVTSTSDKILMSESDALQLQSLYYSLNQLDLQKEQITFQYKELNFQLKQLETQTNQNSLQSNQLKIEIADYKNRIDQYENNNYCKKYNINKDVATIKNGENALTDEEKQIFKEYENLVLQLALLTRKLDNTDNTYYFIYSYNQGDLIVDQANLLAEQKKLIGEDNKKQPATIEDQKDSLYKQSTAIEEQIKLLNSQISYIIAQARANLTLVKEQFTYYLKKKNELEQLINQTPVNYIRDENGVISGFNKYGYLVCMYNPYGKYVVIEYNSSNQITGIYDSNDRKMHFEYVNGLLQSITDDRGRKVQYFYDSNKLSSVIFADGSKIDIEYQSQRMRTITSNNEIQAKITTTSDNKVTSIKNTCSNLLIGKEVTCLSGSLSSKTLSSVAIEYKANLTNLTYNDGLKEAYSFYGSTRLLKYEKDDGCGTRTVTRYSYTNTDGKTVTSISSSNIDEKYETTVETYNEFDQLISKQIKENAVSDSLKVSSTVEYTYDTNNRLIEEKAITDYNNNDEIESQISYVKYHYNAQGSLTITESYGEDELTKGRNIEERVYDESGNVIKTISWNTLDSSSKFYSESEYAENGQVIAEKDETGENSAEYEYVAGTNVVNSVKYSNGGKFAYGRNSFNHKITSITQSTESGESNTTNITYKYDMPVEVKSGNTVLNYTYDYSRRKTSVAVNGTKYADFTYKDYKYNEKTSMYELGSTTTVIDGTTFVQSNTGVNSDEEGKVIKTETLTVNKVELLKKQYNKNQQLETVTYGIIGNSGTNFTINYVYDNYGNTVSATTLKGTADYAKTDYAYSDYGNLFKKTIKFENSTHTYEYKYSGNFENKLDYIGFRTFKFYPLTDVNGRNTGKEIFNGTSKAAGEYISYRKVGDHATNMPSSVWYATGATVKDNIKYSYDKCGNITEIKENGALAVRYAYDSINRLIREDNKTLGKTYLFDYDSNGNITARRETVFTLKQNVEECEFETSEYSYEGDRLIAYNCEQCTYNKTGSPTKYRGKTLAWTYGKLLMNFNGTAFTYDGFGRRMSKGGISYTYDNEGRLIKQSNGLEFIYDQSGVVGIKYTSIYYLFRKDAQGNIIAILDSNGNIVVQYKYDAWGNHAVLDRNGNDITESGNIGNLNPFRYRGYYYDVETGLYYLQTRYYDPETGRFISQDSIEYADPESINGLNLYAYSGNNPVMYADPNGTAEWWQWLLFGIGAALVIAAIVVLCVVTGGAAATLVGAIAIGAAKGALIGAAVGATLGIAGGAIYSAVTGADMGQSILSGFLIGFGIGAIVGAIIGATAGGMKYNWQQGVLNKAESYSVSREKTELHHIVEQCQGKKSGFSRSMIRNSNNEVRITKSLHKEISKYYSSNYANTGMRFRNYLASRRYSFAKQYNIGIKIISSILKGLL